MAVRGERRASRPDGDGQLPTQAVAVVGDGRRGGRRDPDRPRLRHRFLPRTVLGISAVVLAFSVGAALSGTILYSYYQFHLDQTDHRVNTLIDGYKHQFSLAEGDLQAAAAKAKAQIQASLAPIQAARATPATEQALIRRLAPSLYFVTTQTTGGQPSVGAAFVVASSSSQSLLLTSYTAVQAATATPGPPVYVRQGASSAQTPVTVRTWDARRDLALIVLARGGLTPVPVAPTATPVQIGQPVYALSGLGSAGGSVTGGAVADVSSAGLAIDTPIGTAFQGGPVVDTLGQVVAVASRTYAPLGFPTSGVTFAPLVAAACQQVLSCPGGQISASS